MKNCESKLTRLYLLALTVVAITVVSGQVLIQTSLSTSQKDAQRVNIAGRQRMLSVLVVKLAYERNERSMNQSEMHEIEDRMRVAIEKMRKSQFGLIHGDSMLHLHATTDPSELQSFRVVSDPLEQLIVAGNRSLETEPGSETNSTNLRQLRLSQEKFLPLMNDLVFRIGHNANQRIVRAKRLEYIVLAITLLVLVLEAVFVFRPTVAEIRRTISLLRESQATLTESEQRHRDLVKYSAGAIICIDSESGRISDINPSGASQLNHPAENLIGKRFTYFLDSESTEVFGDHVSALGQEESTQCRLSLRVENLGPREWLARLTYYRRHDGDSSILMTMHDITDQAERERKLVEKTQRDALTGLLNRGEFDRRIEEMSQLHESQGIPFTLAMIDIDHFKGINDQFGHQGGDAILKSVAQIVESACRSADVVARYGGEEIAVLFPSLGVRDAMSIAERIRKTLEHSEIEVNQDEKLETAKATISVGLAGAPAHANRVEKLIQIADAALYRAKQSGRNIVKIADVVDDVPCFDDSVKAEANAGSASGVIANAMNTAEYPSSTLAGCLKGHQRGPRTSVSINETSFRHWCLWRISETTPA